jgi:hypothetical protein
VNEPKIVMFDDLQTRIGIAVKIGLIEERVADSHDVRSKKQGGRGSKYVRPPNKRARHSSRPVTTVLAYGRACQFTLDSIRP